MSPAISKDEAYRLLRGRAMVMGFGGFIGFGSGGLAKAQRRISSILMRKSCVLASAYVAAASDRADRRAGSRSHRR